MLRPSPNQGTLRLPNDDDDGVNLLSHRDIEYRVKCGVVGSLCCECVIIGNLVYNCTFAL